LQKHWASFVMPTCGGTVSVSHVWTHAMGQRTAEEISAAFAALPAEQQALMRDSVETLKETLAHRAAWNRRDHASVAHFLDSLEAKN
jgi:hypothetical protein